MDAERLLAVGFSDAVGLSDAVGCSDAVQTCAIVFLVA
jgi:hypothetical protein